MLGSAAGSLAVGALLLLVAAPMYQAAPRPQNLATNDVINEAMSREERENVVASLILLVARDWDMGRIDLPIEFERISRNGTSVENVSSASSNDETGTQRSSISSSSSSSSS